MSIHIQNSLLYIYGIILNGSIWLFGAMYEGKFLSSLNLCIPVVLIIFNMTVVIVTVSVRWRLIVILFSMHFAWYTFLCADSYLSILGVFFMRQSLSLLPSLNRQTWSSCGIILVGLGN